MPLQRHVLFSNGKTMSHDFYLNLAIDEAWKYQGLTFPNPAVGALVLNESGEILSIEAHHKAGEAHAEVKALQVAFSKLTSDQEILKLQTSSEIHHYLLQHHNNIFKQCAIYVTLEPCNHHGKTPSCADLLSALGLKHVYIGHKDENEVASNGSKKLEYFSFLDSQRAEDLIAPFKKWSSSKFVTYKWAQRLDGTVDGGTVSSKESRMNVHAMRDVCDLIVIGGNTVREDRPTLDARLVDGRVCDVFIYSDQKEFDQSIPLFSVQGRSVMVGSDLSALDRYNNILIEGGPSMFEATKNIVDYYLCFVSPKIGGIIPFSKSPLALDLLHSSQDKNDMKLWLKPKKKA